MAKNYLLKYQNHLLNMNNIWKIFCYRMDNIDSCLGDGQVRITGESRQGVHEVDEDAVGGPAREQPLEVAQEEHPEPDGHVRQDAELEYVDGLQAVAVLQEEFDDHNDMETEEDGNDKETQVPLSPDLNIRECSVIHSDVCAVSSSECRYYVI